MKINTSHSNQKQDVGPHRERTKSTTDSTGARDQHVLTEQSAQTSAVKRPKRVRHFQCQLMRFRLIFAIAAIFHIFTLKLVSSKPFDQSYLDRTSFGIGCTGVLSSLKYTEDGGAPLYYWYQAVSYGTDRFLLKLSQIDPVNSANTQYVHQQHHSGIVGA